MKTTMIIFSLVTLMFPLAFSQTDYQQQLISNINSLTAQIQNNAQSPDLYVERSKAIFELNAVSPGQQWVSFALADAIADVNQAMTIKGEDPALYSLRAEYKRDIHGDYTGAVADMDKAISLDPENPDWYFQRAAYQHFTQGCRDYHQCANLNDVRCQKIVRTVCQ